MSAKWGKAEIDLVAVTNRDFYEYKPKALPAVGSALALPAIVHTPPSRVATGKVHQGTPRELATAYSPTLAPEEHRRQ